MVGFWVLLFVLRGVWFRAMLGLSVKIMVFCVDVVFISALVLVSFIQLALRLLVCFHVFLFGLRGGICFCV